MKLRYALALIAAAYALAAHMGQADADADARYYCQQVATGIWPAYDPDTHCTTLEHNP